MQCLVLDAMGVIYEVGDDVVELLHPFIVEKGGTNDLDRIGRLYTEASLGKMTSFAFWEAVGVDPALEDEYLRRHVLRTGLVAFLETLKAGGRRVWCLSNDVSEWSRKLRQTFSIERYFEGFIISGDVRLRKPDPAIYRLVMERLNCKPGDITFVDDNVGNLDAAASQGIVTVLFNSSGGPAGGHREVTNFSELSGMVLPG